MMGVLIPERAGCWCHGSELLGSEGVVPWCQEAGLNGHHRSRHSRSLQIRIRKKKNERCKKSEM